MSGLEEIIPGWVSDIQSYVRVKFVYDKEEPMVFRMTFLEADEDDPIIWIMGRELFKEALNGKKAGHGDVLLTPIGERGISLNLNNGYKGIEIAFVKGVLARFVNKSYALVDEDTARAYSLHKIARQFEDYLRMV